MNSSETSYHSKSTLPSRILATLIDYFFVVSASSMIAKSYPLGDLNFIAFLTFAGLYYTAGNSSVFGGQTIGKRLFGLRTVSLHNSKGDNSPFLNLSSSLLRFIILLGGTIALKEIPPIYYREFLIEGPRSILDLPLLIALAIFIGNIMTALFHSHNLSLHDLLCSSVVIRHPDRETLPTTDRSQLRNSYFKPYIGTLLGVIIGSILWMLSITQPAALKIISEKQYVLEAQLSIKILHVANYQGAINAAIIVSDNFSNEDRFQECSKIATAIAEAALQNASTHNIEHFELACLDQNNRDLSLQVKLNLKSGEISESAL